MNQNPQIADQQTVLCPICSAPSHYDFSGRDLMYGLRVRYDYYQCTACCSVFQVPMPDMTMIASFYPENYMVYDQETRVRKVSAMRQAILRRTRGYKHLRPSLPARVFAFLAAPFSGAMTPSWEGGGRMLDIGCGNGRFMTAMRSLGWAVQGVEFSEAGVSAARMSGLDVHHGDLASAAFPDGAFDLVTVRHVVEHVPDPHGFIAEIARVIRPGGRLVIETPNSDALGRQWFGPRWYANDVPRHLFLFSLKNMELLGAVHGLRVGSVSMDTTPKIFLNSLDYAVGNAGTPSKRIAWRRFLARAYVFLARRSGRGDVFQMVFVKPAP